MLLHGIGFNCILSCSLKACTTYALRKQSYNNIANIKLMYRYAQLGYAQLSQLSSRITIIKRAVIDLL